MLRALAVFAIPLLAGVGVSVGGFHVPWVGYACFALAAMIGAVAVFAETPTGKRVGWIQQLGGLRTEGSLTGAPFAPPVAYQVRQARQVVAKISEVCSYTDYPTLEAALAKIPRRGIDPMFEPLRAVSIRDGLAKLAEQGILEPVDPKTCRYTIIRRR